MVLPEVFRYWMLQYYDTHEPEAHEESKLTGAVGTSHLMLLNGTT